MNGFPPIVDDDAIDAAARDALGMAPDARILITPPARRLIRESLIEERRIIVDMLERCNWNQTEAAERFHVPLSTLNQKIRRHNIEIKKKGRG